MADIRHGVIGLGFFGEMHADVLRDMQGVELAALCTRRPDRLKDLADRFDVPKRYTDYQELLADPEIDSVSVVTHVYDHKDITIGALAAGKHVILEKPMADSVETCDAIVAAAKAAKGKFMVGHICRFDTRVSLAREAIAEGRIGKIVSMHATRNLTGDITGPSGILDKISALLGDGIHDTDIMLWMAQNPIQTVYAQTLQVRNYKYPDMGWAMYRFESGAIGVIETIWCMPDNAPFRIDARMEVVGTEGAVYIDCGNAGLGVLHAEGFDRPDTAYWPVLSGKRVGALRNELGYFLDCVRNDKTPDMITPEESREAVRVICAAEESAETGEVVNL